jgi:nicotinate-nucleotide pyrophosphorylase (carboxylating)
MQSMIRQWIDDDIPSFDVGGWVVGTAERQAVLYMKSPGVLAGQPFFDQVFTELGCRVEWKEHAIEGVYFDAKSTTELDTTTTTTNATSTMKLPLAVVTGPVHMLLRGERTALNTVSRCSGVATAAHASVQHARRVGWHGFMAGTRKTTPGFRVVEKYGLLVGGAATHRLDLSQMVMLKDNHIDASSHNITLAVQRARQAAGFSQRIEVECQSLQEAMEAAQAGADIVMLDNYTPERLREDAAQVKQAFPHVLIEASGGITLETMGDYLSEHVDIVSQGSLTQGYDCIDYSLKLMDQQESSSS